MLLCECQMWGRKDEGSIECENAYDEILSQPLHSKMIYYTDTHSLLRNLEMAAAQ